ncbi:hypothetical protein AYJ54_19605 [Bradyrhizobium centrolobii]|uniref:Glucose-methanol-choline oxidoreductase C-terminal domain-containing protein n=1 Tax=Bradyrhizobium centrolobii TaxID=1505087 RepID=A0A176YIA9_9BRAD|nr:hypothetical protein AYJ54_19605 [Bradyrhizobium centrolobii]
MTDTFDFVVVGAGSGGCAAAGRLSEDAGTSMALLDAGSVALASGDAMKAPLIDPNFLGEEDDLESMLAGFKTTRRLMETPALHALQKDMFTAGVATDDDIRALLRERVDTVYHPVGTSRMGTDTMAVVDPALKVHGVEALRVVDASIMPTLIGGNTNARTIMIGEKAADMIRAEVRAS